MAPTRSIPDRSIPDRSAPLPAAIAEMDTDTADKILSQAARDGSMDCAVWPELLPVVLARIEKIAHTEFRIPNLSTPPPAPPPRPSSPRLMAPLPSSDPADAPDGTATPSSQGTDKENADPTAQPPRRPSAAAPAAAPAAEPPSQQPSESASALPKPIADMLDEVLSVLRTNFPRYPPHTIQRLSELVLQPSQHYRNLVPWLHALDRVVHVTSGANTYPLPPALPDIAAMSLLVNGAGGAGPAGSMTIDTAAANACGNNSSDPGSDEALGGALLTPIPWLSRAVNGDGSDGEDGEGSDAGGGSGSGSGSSSSSSPALPTSQQQQQQQHQQLQLQLQQRHLEARVQTESTETIEGPNGMGSIETVSISVNGIPSTGASVTSFLVQRSNLVQPPPVRQQQQQPLQQRQRRRRRQQKQRQQQQQVDGEGDASMKDGPGSGSDSDAHDDDEDKDKDKGKDKDDEDEDEEIPHARGPAEIGPADTGPLAPAVAELIRSSTNNNNNNNRKRSASPDDAAAAAADRVPPSPKRDAEDRLASETPAKRRRDGDGNSNDNDEDGDDAAAAAAAAAAATEGGRRTRAAGRRGSRAPAPRPRPARMPRGTSSCRTPTRRRLRLGRAGAVRLGLRPRGRRPLARLAVGREGEGGGGCWVLGAGMRWTGLGWTARDSNEPSVGFRSCCARLLSLYVGPFLLLPSIIQHAARRERGHVCMHQSRRAGGRARAQMGAVSRDDRCDRFPDDSIPISVLMMMMMMMITMVITMVIHAT
ncbi:hypothetical protein VTJ83DRAFT_210 [Remersonia thermophila]|uniref:Uncharacterized protein n=1 Tax=Remersonia thermophila TaxID=72144 RepID=A0ABR4DMT8_9PEZI